MLIYKLSQNFYCLPRRQMNKLNKKTFEFYVFIMNDFSLFNKYLDQIKVLEKVYIENSIE